MSLAPWIYFAESASEDETIWSPELLSPLSPVLGERERQAVSLGVTRCQHLQIVVAGSQTASFRYSLDKAKAERLRLLC